MLNHAGIEAKMETAIDNNCIDRMVKAYKPTHVVIEAYWVVPEKFEILSKLHPKVKWIIRNHSEMPFLSMEGSAIQWTLAYAKHPKVFLSTNSKASFYDLDKILTAAYGPDVAKEKLFYLPNYYKVKVHPRSENCQLEYKLDIGCFGAIRPLKNQFLQAIAAVNYANEMQLFLRYHINVARSRRQCQSYSEVDSCALCRSSN